MQSRPRCLNEFKRFNFLKNKCNKRKKRCRQRAKNGGERLKADAVPEILQKRKVFSCMSEEFSIVFSKRNL